MASAMCRLLCLTLAALSWQLVASSRTSIIVDEVIAGLKALGMTWTEEQEFGIVERLQLLVRLRHNYPYPRDDRGRGILMVGNGVQLKNSYISLRMLRENLKCNLPVEIAYNGQDEAPKPELKRLFEEMPDVRLLDSSSIKLNPAVFSGLHAEREDQARRHGFSQKIFAITFVTTFTEVLFLDTDNLPLINPEMLFTSSGYQQSGGMFWPDWWTREGIVPMKPGLYHILHVPVPWEETSDGSYRGAESGQILLDRHRHRDVLQWLWWLAVNHNITDRYLHGDKDLFRIAFVLAGKGPEYDQIPIPARQAVGIRPTNNGSVLEHLGMVQLTPSGGLAFHHRTAKCKYFPHCHGRQESCRVVYLTASLSHDEAVKSNGNEGIWKPEHVDVTAWDSLGCRTPKEGEPDDMPEMLCTRQTEPDQRLVPLFEVDKFGKTGEILQAAHELVLRLERDFPYVF